MTTRNKTNGPSVSSDKKDNLIYIQEMLVELRQVAENENEDMLCYLIEMAYIEAGDVLSKDGALAVHGDRNKSSRMSM